MRARSPFGRAVAAVVLVALAAGCRGDAVAPGAADGAHLPSLDLASGDNSTTVFTYDPAVADTFPLTDQHRITFSANAVCDPAVSTYGVTEWDRPCTPLTTPITITAVSSVTPNGHPRVDFSPALRFVPGSRVVLYMRDKKASSDPDAVMLWCDAYGLCVDESESLQRSYETKRDEATGVVYRAITHFSGYIIAAGRA